MGNSEVGHMNLGAGRVVMQDLPRINKAVTDGTLADIPALKALIDKARAGSGRCYHLGLRLSRCMRTNPILLLSPAFCRPPVLTF